MVGVDQLAVSSLKDFLSSPPCSRLCIRASAHVTQNIVNMFEIVNMSEKVSDLHQNYTTNTLWDRCSSDFGVRRLEVNVIVE